MPFEPVFQLIGVTAETAGSLRAIRARRAVRRPGAEPQDDLERWLGLAFLAQLSPPGVESRGRKAAA
jgi:hypothetical protein